MKLAFLRPLYDSFGDYVSAYLDVDRAREDAQHAIDLRWRSGREQLAVACTDAELFLLPGDLPGPAAVSEPPCATRGRGQIFIQNGRWYPPSA